jgi:DNA-binding response OmpR family regulator
MKPHILVVEDHDNTRIALTAQLRYAGYQVTQAANGEAALALLTQETFDVVLADIVMDGVDGIKVLHAARQQPYRPEVILLTGNGMLQSAIAAIRAGAYDYLLKPCDEETLLACIDGAVKHHHAEQRRSEAERHLLEAASLMSSITTHEADAPGTPQEPPTSPPTTARQPRQVGSLAIGITRHDVTFAGTLLHVTPIEYALLRYLAATPGEVRRYHEIVRATHQVETSDSDAQNLLRTHIRNLRKKLPAAYLVTEHGIGCKLVHPREER